MRIKGQYFIILAFILLFITVNCQVEKTTSNNDNQSENKKAVKKQTATADSKLQNNKVVEKVEKVANSQNQIVNTKGTQKNETNGKVSAKVATTDATVESTAKTVSEAQPESNVETPTSNANVETVAETKTQGKEKKNKKAKAEALEKYPIEDEDLSLIKWSEFDHNGFNIAISTPNVFDETAVINIKWQAINNLKPSSSIKIELHTNLTRRNDYTIYPTAETIIIDDNIPNNVNEVNWNPNVKFRKYEKYYIRIWAYTNSNTATMSGYCLWSINDVLPVDELDIEEVVPKKNGKIKKVAFPCIGALLSFTVIGHFVMQSRNTENKYKNLEDEESDINSHDGLTDRGEQIYYDAIKIEGNERSNLHPLPQVWQIEAKKKQNKDYHQASLSDNSSNYQKMVDDSESFDDISAVLGEGQEPFSITIEKPVQQKIQKKARYEIKNVETSSPRRHRREFSEGSEGSDNRRSFIDMIRRK